MATRIRYAVLLAMVGAGCFMVPAWASYTDITVEQGYQKWLGGVFMLDVRTTGEVAQGFVPGAYNIDVNELASRLDELAGMADTEIVVYCKAGSRSTQASAILDSNGFTHIDNMLGGFDGWKAAGYPTETGDAQYQEVSVEDGHTMWLDGTFVLDVRSIHEYSAGHVPDAHCIPAAVLAVHVKDLAGKENTPILVYCSGATCGLGPYAAGVLADNGFTRVFVMTDGIEGWTDAGYPIQVGLQSTLPLACNMGTIGAGSSGGPWGDLTVLVMTIAFLWAVARRMSPQARASMAS